MSSGSRPVATTQYGDVRGLREGDVFRFRGVPFAQPPMGALRFRAPKPPRPWDGLRDAHADGPAAPQPPSRLADVVGQFDIDQSEDCLTLTITTPDLEGGSLPVFVWLHGGGYSSGAGSLPWYDGGPLARDGGVVVVGVNYRLGPLGYLGVDGVDEVDGLAGVRDMAMALEWVRENIAAFGGDPTRVTVAGQSAGAQGILCMLTMPEVRRCFQRAVLQSPPAGVKPFSRAKAGDRAKRLASLLGHPGLRGVALADALQGVPVENLLAAGGALARETASFGSVEPPFFPVLDEFADADRLLDAAARGAAESGIPLLVGTTRDEGRTMTVGTEPAAEQVDAFVDAALGARRATFERARALRRAPGDLLAAAVTDTAFLADTVRFAEAASRAGAAVWLYELDWAPAGSALGACHCLDLPLVFGTFKAWAGAPMLAGANPVELRELSKQLQASWVRFMADGDPESSLPWPRYEESRRWTMRFDILSGPVGDLAGADWRL